MINIIKSVLEAAEDRDFSLKSIDPKEKSYTEETDSLLYKEAYEKACIGIKTCYDSHEKLFREIMANVRYDCERTYINRDLEKNVELHIISVNPQIDFNVMKLLDDFFTSTDMSKFNSSDEVLSTLEANVISQMGSTPITKEGYIGPIVSLPMKGILVAENLNMVERNIMNAADELYTVYEFIGKKIAEEKNPMYLEAYARIFEYCAKLISYEIGAYGVAALELLQVGRNIMPINESTVLNEGIIGGIFKGIMIAPIALSAGAILFASIYSKIIDIKDKKVAKKQRNKLVLVKDNNNIILKNCDKLLDNAKFAKYNPDTISAMKDLTNLITTYDKKLKDIDDKFKSIKTVEEFQKKKSYFEKEYKEIYDSVVKEFESINKYKDSKKEWVTDLNVVKVLKDYLHIIHDTYYRNLDGDDWWEGVDFLWDNRNDIPDDIWHEAYETFSTFPEYEVSDIGDVKFPFSMIKIQFTGDTMNESAILLEATNEENARKYIDEIDKLIDEVRAFYDKFEYKEIIIPRKKKEPKMYEYVLGALQRKYTLRIPIYKVEGASDDVKDIVEHKFIDKLESITKKYPNFVIMSPNWENESDMFIYITLREPFGDKEDRKDREEQVQNESTEDPNYAINRKIAHLQKKIETNEMVQDRYIAANGYENKSIAEEHDRMCDQMEELCRQRREANNTQNESVTLNEGVGTVLKIAGIAAITLPVADASFRVIIDMIKAKLEGKKLTSLKNSKNMDFYAAEKVINKIKFAKYNPDVIPFMNDIIKLSDRCNAELNKIDKEFHSIKTVDEYLKKKKYFNDKYINLQKTLESDADNIINKYKNSKKEWVENLDIIPELLKYIKHIQMSEFDSREDEDIIMDGLDFIRNASDEDLDKLPDGYDPYYVFTKFKYDCIGRCPKFEEPFSMIKVQFSGKTINESVTLLEASLSKSEKDALEDYEFGLPEKRTYPLNDEVRIKQAIKFFGYCKASDKKTLADNIVRRIIELDLVGVVTISPSHPNKKFFPEWMLDTCKPTLERKGNKYTIYVDGERVDYGTLEDHSFSDEGTRVVVVNESGMLF